MLSQVLHKEKKYFFFPWKFMKKKAKSCWPPLSYIFGLCVYMNRLTLFATLSFSPSPFVTLIFLTHCLVVPVGYNCSLSLLPVLGHTAALWGWDGWALCFLDQWWSARHPNASDAGRPSLLPQHSLPMLARETGLRTRNTGRGFLRTSFLALCSASWPK